MNRDIWQQGGTKTQYSIIPQFHYSNCERSELTCVYSQLKSPYVGGSEMKPIKLGKTGKATYRKTGLLMLIVCLFAISVL